MKKIITLIVIVLLGGHQINAQENYWSSVNESNLKTDVWAGKHFKPAEYKIFSLQETSLKGALQNTPSEKIVSAAKSTKIISIPTPSGKLERFRIVEASVMEPALAAKYPGIKSYAGKGIDDPSATIRCDYTTLGFHAMVVSNNRPTYYINPIDKANNIYEVNARSNNDKRPAFKCSTEDNYLPDNPLDEKVTTLSGNANDGNLSTFRLALCVTGSFSQYFFSSPVSEADSIATMLSVINTYLTRADEVYERDFGIRMVFVSNEDTLIFLHGSSDPFNDNSFGTLNNACETTCDNRIGQANYDIGHVIALTSSEAADNGNAGCIGCVCRNTSAGGNLPKGSGATGYYNPELTEYFVIDYWTHEMGHQFGANHTFTWSIEGTQAQVEPGSGITIMGYAGITGSTDIADHSIDIFDAVSIAQDTKYILTGYGKNCAVKNATGDIVPIVNAGADYIIPMSTPFQLAGTGSDADAGDVPSYVWEQIDNYASGSNTFPKAKSTDGPVFRDYLDTSITTRYIPILSSILDGTNKNKWEVLPSVARTLDFRFTIRDNHPGGGQNNSDDMAITVDTSSGPFKVTVANTAGVVVTGNSNYTVTWDVANTTAAPVSCSNVDIILSTDGGLTFTDTLAKNVANNGSAVVVAPNINNTTCRIMVKAHGNIFLDINDANFSITASLPLSWLSFTGQLKGATTLLNWATANEVNNNYFSVERSTDAVHYSSIGTVNAAARPTSNNPYSFTDKNPLVGTDFYRLKQVDKDGNYHYSSVVKVTVGKNGSWVVYPNPATTNTTVAVKSDLNNVSLTLSNAGGQMVYNLSMQKASAGQIINVPVNNLSKGVYVLKIKSDEGINSEKIVVE